MPTTKKTPAKKRGKYQDKLKINLSFNEVINAVNKDADKKVNHSRKYSL